MPNVELTNPIVQIDLANSERMTVPAGERWKVSLIGDPAETKVRINSEPFTRDNNVDTTQHIRIDLFGGDTIKSGGSGPLRIRGYQVEQ